MSRKAHMTHQRVKLPTKGDEMKYDENFLETAVAADSVGKSEVELRDQRADNLFAGLVTALAVDVCPKKLTVLSAMDIELSTPALQSRR